MRKIILSFIAVFFIYSQPKVVKSVFKSTRLINLSTTEQLYAGTFEYRIGHRFGDANSGINEMFGLDLGANTLLGFDFGITNDLKMGFSRANLSKNYGVNLQYRIFQQSRDDKMPVTISYVGGSNYLSQNLAKEYYFSSEFLISRKFTSDFSLQLAPFLINILKSKDLAYPSHIAYGSTFSGRYKVTKKTAIIFEWSPMFNRDAYNKKSSLSRRYDYDNFALAYNIESSGHSFQIILANSQEASMITSKLGSIHQAFDKHFYLGFNITRLFFLFEEE